MPGKTGTTQCQDKKSDSRDLLKTCLNGDSKESSSKALRGLQSSMGTVSFSLSYLGD